MRPAWLALTAWLPILAWSAAAIAPAARGQAGSASNPVVVPVVVVDFSNPGISPSQWTLTLHRDGIGHFHSERGKPPVGEHQEIDPPDLDREIQLSAEFAERVFIAARNHNWFNQDCDSHLKVAFQGWKKLSYLGPEGQGACTFNYSKDKDIQALGDSLVGVAETLREGARLQMLLQHDPLGLDQEMEYLTQAAKDGRVQQVGAIREILERLADDQDVLDRVRKRARVLLKQAGT
jgi:hypothetical protein